MFGKVQENPQTENTLLSKKFPYGVSKLYAHWMTINYRESYDIFGAMAFCLIKNLHYEGKTLCIHSDSA